MTQKFLRDDGTFAAFASSGSSAKGPVTLLTKLTTADITLSNSALYFDGPSVSQGSSGTWYVSGTVTLADVGGAATFYAKLWDGTNLINSASATSATASFTISISLSGVITSPAGDLRISVRDATRNNGVIQFNASGASSGDSNITAIRIG